MKRIFIITLVGLMGSIGQVAAQGKAYAIQYTVGFAMGDFSDFISQPCFRGATFDYRKMIRPNIGVGFEAGWSAFYEEIDYDTYTDGTESISGKQWRYCSVVPILIDVNYYLKPVHAINPFGGLGIGAQYSASELDMGVYAITTNTWHFTIKPELGVVFNLDTGVGIMVSAKYYNAFKTQESDARSFIGANVGLAWGF